MKGKTEAGGDAFIIGVDMGKEAVYLNAAIEEPGPRYMHYPLDERAGYDRAYFKGLFAERQVLRRKNGQSVFTWEKVYERNEPLDMRNYARAAYKYFRWKFDEIEKSLRGEDIDPPQTRAQRERKKSRRVISRGIRV